MILLNFNFKPCQARLKVAFDLGLEVSVYKGNILPSNLPSSWKFTTFTAVAGRNMNNSQFFWIYLFGFLGMVYLSGNSSHECYANQYLTKGMWRTLGRFMELSPSLCISILSASMPCEFLPPWVSWCLSSLFSVQSDCQIPPESLRSSWKIFPRQ